MFNVNKVLTNTTAFIVPKGSKVIVFERDDESETGFDIDGSFETTFPFGYFIERKAENEFRIGKCDCCENKIFSFYDHFNNWVTLNLEDVTQICSKSFVA
jgi:hypothetical protein